MTTAFLLAFLVLTPSQEPAQTRDAGDFLPEPGAYSWDKPRPHELALSDLLLPTDLSRKCVMVVRPSFEAEWAVYVSGDATGRKIVLRALRKPLSAEVVAQMPAKPPTVKFISPGGEVDLKTVEVASKFVTQQASPVSEETAGVLELAWQKVLDRVRYSAEMQRMLAGADGTSFHISQCGQGGCLSGRTWSPEKGSIASRLVEIAEEMRAYAQAGGAGGRGEASLRSKTKALADALLDYEQGRK